MIVWVVGASVVFWILRQRPVVAVAMCFLLFSFAWRLVAAGYLDFNGPVYSEQLEQNVGGGSAGETFCGAIVLVLLIFASVLAPRRLIAGPSAQALGPDNVVRRRTIGDLVFVAGVLFIAALYFDLAARGNVPLFACIERYVYTSEIGGPFHQALYKYGALISLQFGVCVIYPRLLGRTPDYRFIPLLIAFALYFLLTGNRFSAFYSMTGFFLMPFAALLLAQVSGRLPPLLGADKRRGFWGQRTTLAAVSGVLVLLVSAALIHSYVFVRSEYGACKGPVGYTDLLRSPLNTALKSSPKLGKKLKQRFLIQPVELWWLTWGRLHDNGQWEPWRTAKFIFGGGKESSSNNTPRYLMNLALKPERAAILQQMNVRFAGGFPEIVFELFGVYGAWPALALVALLAAWFLRVWLLSIMGGYLLTSFWAMYVFYAFSVMFIGGMVTFLLAWTFWVKVVLFFATYIAEWRVLKAPLVRWDLWTVSSVSFR